MRRTVTAVALAVTAALLTGCGSDNGNAKGKTGGDSGKAPETTRSAPPTPAAGEATHEVTLEVRGTGSTQIMWHAAGSGFEQQTLPWSKTETVELTAAEQKVGYLLSVVPGSVKGADGMLKQAPCTIKVDGKQVADNDGGKNPKGCTYKLT
ncbi:hypothetical protein [Streptomyces sp. NPDC006368]|uniref:hypothetical protein n=1 Tax=Streptomyces sp. NPDC006368 TaxID=3156760 RepID=UPI0033AA6203